MRFPMNAQTLPLELDVNTVSERARLRREQKSSMETEDIEIFRHVDLGYWASAQIAGDQVSFTFGGGAPPPMLPCM